MVRNVTPLRRSARRSQSFPTFLIAAGARHLHRGDQARARDAFKAARFEAFASEGLLQLRAAEAVRKRSL
jgi:hypothetical protein